MEVLTIILISVFILLHKIDHSAHYRLDSKIIRVSYFHKSYFTCRGKQVPVICKTIGKDKELEYYFLRTSIHFITESENKCIATRESCNNIILFTEYWNNICSFSWILHKREHICLQKWKISPIKTCKHA